jgi:hypothetical protein
MLTFIKRLFKGEIVNLLILSVLDALLRIGISVLILYLFNAVTDNRMGSAYGYAAGVLVAWYLNQLARQATYVHVNLCYVRIKAAFGLLLYAKVSSLYNNAIKHSELGKITNLIASDLGAL